MPQPSLLLDVPKIQKRIDKAKENPYQVKTGTFHAPIDMGRDMFEHTFAERVRVFMRAMSDEGWELHSKVVLMGPFEATDPYTGLLIPGQQEYRVRGVFKYRGSTPKAIRVELDPNEVKQAPDHILTTEHNEDLKKAAKGPIAKLIEDAYTA